jgi:hypothetical protein
MNPADTILHCFAYGEHLDGLAQRSLGYRLLAPARPQSWSAEVEALARRLQTTPYPDHWPPTDLFCSVLLSDGSRLIAVARYGLADHTPSGRRGGLELIGAIGPAHLSAGKATAIYNWLRKRRGAATDLHSLGGEERLSAVAIAVSEQSSSTDPVPVLPIRLWQEGALLFAATTPTEPDHRIGMLEQNAGNNWQWLPLVGSDFPLQTYAQRGPLIAWTPHLSGVALKVDRTSVDAPRPKHRMQRWAAPAIAGILLLLVVLTVANLWATVRGNRSVESATAGMADQTVVDPKNTRGLSVPAVPARQAFADALFDVLMERGGQAEWEAMHDQLIARYERAARDNQNLRLSDDDVKGRSAVGAVLLLNERSTRRIEEAIKKGLNNRGFDAELVNVACQRVREQLMEEARRSP